MRRFLLAFAATASMGLAFAQPASAAVHVLDFEGFDYDVVPGAVGTFSTYGGLHWTNGAADRPYWINVNSAANCVSPCGFVAGLTSGVQVATQINGVTSVISSVTPFKPVSVNLSSAWRNDELITFTGLLDNVQVWTASYSASTTGPGANSGALITFSGSPINELRVLSSGGTLQGLGGSSAGAVLDNFTFDDQVPTPVPEPSTWAMMLIGFAGLGMAMRRRGASGRSVVDA